MPSPSAPAAEEDALRPEQLFAGLACARGVVAAVSGGVDSTALMLLLARWTERPPVLVVSVDHGLRPEAAGEARVVAENAARLGLPVRIMQAPQRLGTGNLQDWARRARYALLAEAARDASCDTIVTAHHQDDQAETFLLRLARGSGVYGLGAMASDSLVGEIRVARPLLGISRPVLAAAAAASGLSVVDDPSNSDLRFDRVRLRCAAPTLATIGLTPARLSGTAGRMARAAAALDHYTGELLRSHFTADPFGVVCGPAVALAGVPEEVSLRALARMLNVVSGADYPPRLDRLEALHTMILSPMSHGRLQRTLHGAVLVLEEGRLTVRREWGRAGLPTVGAPAGTTFVWDRRFRVRVPSARADMTVAALGRSARRLRLTNRNSSVVRSLPGLFGGGELLAVPPGVWAEDDAGPELQDLVAECVVGEHLGRAVTASQLSPF